jgi:hypothetical protein
MKKSELEPGIKYQAYSPKGHPIRGTYEMTPGVARARGFTATADGYVECHHTGDTDMFWDGMTTQTNPQGKILYLCSDGNEWTEDELDFREEE